MAERTAIGWTDHSFNPWWGCTRVSPGCQHCYAETFSRRVGHSSEGSKVALWGKGAERRFFGDKHWADPLKWDRAAAATDRPARVFCASMADVFEDRADLEGERERLFDLIEATPHLMWLLLTKRPQNVLRLAPERWWMDPGEPSNVWIGTTVEDQQRADERLPHLAAIPAAVRFLSCEPLLGPVDIGSPWLEAGLVDWVICGGESGPGHRLMDLDHARVLRDQCRRWGVPFFFKQVGGATPTAGGDLLDGEQVKMFPRGGSDG